FRFAFGSCHERVLSSRGSPHWRFSVAASRRRAPPWPIQRVVSPQLPPNCRACAWTRAWARPSHPRHGGGGIDDVILAGNRCRLLDRGQQQVGIAVASVPHGIIDLPGVDVDRTLADQQPDGLRIGPGLRTQSERLGPRVPLTSLHRVLLIGTYERVAGCAAEQIFLVAKLGRGEQREQDHNGSHLGGPIGLTSTPFAQGQWDPSRNADGPTAQAIAAVSVARVNKWLRGDEIEIARVPWED